MMIVLVSVRAHAATAKARPTKGRGCRSIDQPILAQTRQLASEGARHRVQHTEILLQTSEFMKIRLQLTCRAQGAVPCARGSVGIRGVFRLRCGHEQQHTRQRPSTRPLVREHPNEK